VSVIAAMKTVLNPRHKIVADHWLIHHNKYKALISAEYSHQTASKAQSSVFDRVDVSAYIQNKRDIMSKKAGVTAEFIVTKYLEIINASMGEVLVQNEDGTASVDLSLASPEFMASLSSYSADEFSDGRGKGKKSGKRIRVQLQDKLRALEALARHLGMFNDRITVEGNVNLVERIQKGRERARIKDITQDVELINDEV